MTLLINSLISIPLIRWVLLDVHHSKQINTSITVKKKKKKRQKPLAYFKNAKIQICEKSSHIQCISNFSRVNHLLNSKQVITETRDMGTPQSQATLDKNKSKSLVIFAIQSIFCFSVLLYVWTLKRKYSHYSFVHYYPHTKEN